jgi:hypothetical protein
MEQCSIQIPDLPLAVYRELAAHLLSCEGVLTNLLPQTSDTFDYNQSQIGGVMIEYTPSADWESRQRVEQILAYYKNRYGVS